MSKEQKIYILWVDDSWQTLSAIVKLLERTDYEVLTASSTEAALTLARDYNFNLIVSDIMMPPPDGIDFLAMVNELQPDTPLMIFSAYIFNNVYRERIRNLGFHVKVVRKTSLPSALLKEIKEIVENKTPISIKTGKRSESEKNHFLKKLIDSIEVKPGWMGLSVKLKKLVEEFRKNDS